MRTVNMEIWERSRIWNPSEDEKFVLKLKLYGNQEEIEKIRETIFTLESVRHADTKTQENKKKREGSK